MDQDEPGRPTDTGSVFTDPESDIPRLDKSTIREKLLANEFVQGMIRQCRGVKALIGGMAEKMMLTETEGKEHVSET